MPVGIGASLTTLTNGTTANAPDVMNNLNAINNSGVSNDGGNITTNGSGALAVVQLLLTTGSFTRVSPFGPYAVTTTTTLFAHNLGVVPDLILLVITGALSTVRTVVYDDSFNDATNCKLTGSGSFNVRGLAIKF